MLFCGDDVNNPNGVDHALKWEDDIRKYTDIGVQIIAHLEGYMRYKSIGPAGAAKASKERQDLVKLAKDKTLTIYLPNGETITGKTYCSCYLL